MYSPTLDEGDKKLFLGDRDTYAMGIHNHSIIVFKYLLQNQNKGLIMCKNKTSLRLYYQSMVRMMKENYNIVVPVVPNEECWACGVKGAELKKCTRCKFALYCDKKCQKNDWKRVHKEVCLPPNID